MEDIGCRLCHRHGVDRPATMYVIVRMEDIYLVCDSHAALYRSELLYFLPVPDDMLHLVRPWSPPADATTRPWSPGTPEPLC